jgi:hypothetical protein
VLAIFGSKNQSNSKDMRTFIFITVWRQLILQILAYCLFFCSFAYSDNKNYIAFSLKVAEKQIKKSGLDNIPTNIFFLSGITQIKGMVYDKALNDVIIVGIRDYEKATLTLDDFVVALRARFIYNRWPLVSIDPMKGSDSMKMQTVRFEGGIQNTQFGQDLFEADYTLKKIGMGFIKSGIPGFKSYFDLRAQALQDDKLEIGSRFWFYPVSPSLSEYAKVF